MSGQDAWPEIMAAMKAAGIPRVARRYAAFLWAKWLWRDGGECRESRANLAAAFDADPEKVRLWERLLCRSGLFVAEVDPGRWRTIRLSDTPGRRSPGPVEPGPVEPGVPRAEGAPTPGRGSPPPRAEGAPQTQETQETQETHKGAREARWDVILASDEFAALRADPEWVQAWSDWIEHAKTSGTKAKVPAGPRAKVIFRQAVKAGPAVHVLAIQAAMANNWQGINPEWLKDGPELREARARAASAAARREKAVEAARARLAEIESGGRYAKDYLDIERRGDEADEAVIERLRAYVGAARQTVGAA